MWVAWNSWLAESEARRWGNYSFGHFRAIRDLMRPYSYDLSPEDELR